MESRPLSEDRRRRRRRRIAFVLGATAALVVCAAVVLARREQGAGRGGAAPLGRDARAPEGVRIKVQVLNATRTRGLARRATRRLRDGGFDVVETGTASAVAGQASLDSTLVLDRSGHPEYARRVAAALGGARVEARPDSSRYLDVTVLLGASWRPPPGPLDP